MAIQVNDFRQLERALATRPRADAELILAKSAQRLFPVLVELLRRGSSKRITSYFRFLFIISINYSIEDVDSFSVALSHDAIQINSIFSEPLDSSSSNYAWSAHEIFVDAASALTASDENSLLLCARVIESFVYTIANLQIVSEERRWFEIRGSWALVQRDIEELYRYGEKFLIEQAMWPDARPSWANNCWQALRTHLLATEDEDWGVWVDWYDTVAPKD